MLQNLLSNALKYSDPPRWIRLSAQGHEGGARISVEDNGVGIPLRLHRRIFRRFYRPDAEREREGLGLGLAMTEHVVRAHRGRVGVESEEGKGSVFTIELPGGRA